MLIGAGSMEEKRSDVRKSFVFFKDQRILFDSLSEEDAGKLIKAIFAYVCDREDYQGDNPVITMAFNVFKITHDRNSEAYNIACEKKAQARKRGWDQKKSSIDHYRSNSDSDNDSDNDSEIESDNKSLSRSLASTEEPESASGFEDPGRSQPPHMWEISRFVAENHLEMDSMRFKSYYDDNGWTIRGKPIKDWQAAARSWAKHEKKRKKQ